IFCIKQTFMLEFEIWMDVSPTMYMNANVEQAILVTMVIVPHALSVGNCLALN
ncbi:34063_t:CDS:2, partial [Racocetra persica]